MLAKCDNHRHPKFAAGMIDLCLVCHFRTDEAFAMWSQILLALIKELDKKKKGSDDPR